MAEPWLRGPMEGVDALIAPVLRSLEQTREDLEQHTSGLSTDQIWAQPQGFAPLGFQLRHIAGSIERLLTYAEGGQLSEQQMAALKAEMTPGPNREELLAAIDAAIAGVESMIRRTPVTELSAPRGVGRKMLPTTVIGLLVHIAEHTQRHVGEAIVMAKLARLV